MVSSFPCRPIISRAFEAELASKPANMLDAPLLNNSLYPVDIPVEKPSHDLQVVNRLPI